MVATGLQIIGAALVSVGAGMIFLPVGVILAGAFSVLFGISLERR